MSHQWIAVAAGLAMAFSTSAFAQDTTGSGGAASATAAPAQSPATFDQATAPNAPTQPTDPAQAGTDGPLPAGDEAGTPVAAAWTPSVAEIAAAGAVAVGAAICIATCGGSSNTSTTTTTSPK
ncbi:MAG TPA: hypothetical protein VHY79_06895 [Rhizomicrobium sp.]|nr:hypothetical protein [Rhizomicrobium sp.]